MKIEKKRKSSRRQKKQRHSSLEKRATAKSKVKSYGKNEPTIDDKNLAADVFHEENSNSVAADSSLSATLANSFFTNVRSAKMLSPKLVLTALICFAIVIVSFNINPILKSVFTDQNSAVYPVLKKYADELRGISSRLTVVTRRLNMLSLVSEENELNNINRINSLVLQINDMWFTTKKYLNFIGIETIAHTELEREIDANSKVNEKGLLRETKVEQSFPEDQITLTSVLKLDSIIQDLDIQIDNINNEITYLEDNVYAAIKASHIYSHLLERSRNANGNYYASSSVSTNRPTDKYRVNNQPLVTPTKKIAINNQLSLAPTKISKIESLVKTKENIIISKSQNATRTTNTISSTPVITSNNTIKQDTIANKTTVTPKKDIVLVNVEREKIVGAFTLKNNTKNKSRKDKTNKLTKKKKTEPKIVIAKIKKIKKPVASKTKIIKVEEQPFENPFLDDDIILDFVTNYDDYGDLEEDNSRSRNSNPIEEDDYTGG